jgi:hypothetical protein
MQFSSLDAWKIRKWTKIICCVTDTWKIRKGTKIICCYSIFIQHLSFSESLYSFFFFSKKVIMKFVCTSFITANNGDNFLKRVLVFILFS